MKKNGFTLIELLAVILILGVISLIAIPVVSGLIEDAKKESLKVTASNIVRAAEEKCQIEAMKGNDATASYTISDGSISNALDIKGLPENGIINVDSECNAVAYVSDGKYCAIKDGENVSINLNVNNCGEVQEVEETEESCFIFDSMTHTITGYKYEDETCPSDITIPDSINGVPVEHIAELAFVNADYDYIITSTYKEVVDDDDEIFENSITAYDILENTRKLGYNEYLYFYFVKLKEGAEDSLVKHCISSLNDSAITEVAFDYAVTDQDSYITCYIYDKVNEYYDVSEYVDYVYSSGITSVDFSKAINLISIGDLAFYGNSIENVKFGNLPKLTSLGNGSFAENLITDEVDLSGLTNVSNISDVVFYKNNISTLKLPNNTKKIGHLAFSNNSIDSVEFPNTLEKIKMQSFENNLLTTVVIPTNTVTVLSDAFESNQIKNLTLSDNMKVIYYGAFYDNQLESVDIPDSVEIIDAYAFGSNSITEIEIPSNVFYLSGFDGNLITEINIPANVKTIGYYAFIRNSISELTIPNTVDVIDDGAFAYNAIATLDLGTNITYLGASSFYGNTATIANLVIPDSLEVINHGTFYETKITNLTIGKNIRNIGASAFYSSGISNITWGENLKEIEKYAFHKHSFTEVSIPEGVTFIGPAAFLYGKKLQTVNIPDSVTKIEYSAFSSMATLQTVNIGSGITKIGSNGFGCFNESACANAIITINRAENAIGGAPWGHCNATVNWIGTN